MLRFDFVDLSRAHVTPEGWIRDRPVLSRSGVFSYTRADGTVQREYRPPEEVFHPDHLASLRGVPVTDGHPGRVTAANPDAIVGAVLTAGEREDQNLVAELVIHNTGRLGSRRELSLGYSLELDMTPGTTPEGEHYDAIQRNPRVNHLAVVHRGRAGNARLRLDREDAASEPVDPPASGPPSEEGTMPNLTTVRLDGGLSYDNVPQEVAHALTVARDTLANERARHETILADMRRDHEAALAEANRRADAAEAERDALKAKETDNTAAVEKARNDAIAETRTRMELEAEAKKHGVEVRADMSDRAIREAVVRKLRTDAPAFAGKSDEYVQYAFDHAIRDSAAVEEAAARNRVTVNGGGGARADGGAASAKAAVTSASAARELMLRRRAAY